MFYLHLEVYVWVKCNSLFSCKKKIPFTLIFQQYLHILLPPPTIIYNIKKPLIKPDPELITLCIIWINRELLRICSDFNY